MTSRLVIGRVEQMTGPELIEVMQQFHKVNVEKLLD
jgi:hypothetical protein